MSFTAKIAAGVASVTLAGGGAAMLGPLAAGASTSSCVRGCANVYSLKFGPGFTLDVFHGTSSWGQPLILFQTSSSDPAEDFVITDLGTVNDLSGAGLVSGEFAYSYGSLDAYEIHYEPNGLDSHLCAGTWPGAAPQPSFKVRLVSCGQTASTIWASATDTIGGETIAAGYHVFVNAASDGYTSPEVLNYPAGHPAGMPRPWLNVQPLTAYSNGEVFDSQQWTTETTDAAASAGRAISGQTAP